MKNHVSFGRMRAILYAGAIAPYPARGQTKMPFSVFAQWRQKRAFFMGKSLSDVREKATPPDAGLHSCTGSVFAVPLREEHGKGVSTCAHRDLCGGASGSICRGAPCSSSVVQPASSGRTCAARASSRRFSVHTEVCAAASKHRDCDSRCSPCSWSRAAVSAGSCDISQP